MTFSSALTLRVRPKGSRIFQYVAGITGTLGIVSSEMHYGWPSQAIPSLTSGNYTITISQDEASWLTIMPLLGAIFGASISGVVVDWVGRKNIILFNTFPFLAAWIIIAFAKESIYLHIARFLAGLGDGSSFTVVPIYLAEIAEPQIRGLLASLCPVAIVVGLLLVNIFGAFLEINDAALISTIVPVTLLLTFIWMPETPYSLLMRNRPNEARISLQILRGKQDVEKEFKRLSMAVKKQNENGGKFLDLFRIASNRKAVFIVLGLRTVQQVCGIAAVTMYCKTIFIEANSFISPSIGAILYFVIQLVLSVISSILVDIFGRRPLLLLSTIGTFLTLCLNGTYLYIKNCTDIDVSGVTFVPVLALVLYIVIFSIGLQTIPLLLISEMFPTNVKAFAICLADIYFCFIASAVSKFFHFTTAQFGMHVPFYTFAVCAILGLFFIVFCVPETKGKTLEDIQDYLEEKCEKQRIKNSKNKISKEVFREKKDISDKEIAIEVQEKNNINNS